MGPMPSSSSSSSSDHRQRAIFEPLRHRRGGIRRSARRAADGRDRGPGRPAGGVHGRRRTRDGRAGARQPRPDRRPRGQWLCRDPGAAADHPAPSANRDAAAVDRRAARCARHHRQSRFHPPGGATRACGGTVDPDHRLRLADGVGVAAGTGGSRCGAMSIMCSRCCRSSRMPIGDSAARPAPMSDIRLIEQVATLRPECATRPHGAMPPRRSCSSCRGAAAARCGGTSACSARRWPRWRHEIGAVEIVLPTVPHLVDEVTQATRAGPTTPRIVVDAAEKWAAFRQARAALAASGNGDARTRARRCSDRARLSRLALRGD